MYNVANLVAELEVNALEEILLIIVGQNVVMVVNADHVVEAVLGQPHTTDSWWQVKDGDVTTDGNLTSKLSSGSMFNIVGLGGSLNTGSGTISTPPTVPGCRASCPPPSPPAPA